MEHFSKALTALSATLLLLLLLAPLLVMAADPDPLQDFCVADLNGTPSVNGHPCLPPLAAGDEFLFSTRIAAGGDPLANPNGSNVTELDVSEWPGVSMNRVDFAPGGTNPPHIHPRATEVGLVTRGELLVGIIGSLDSGNRYYSKVVAPNPGIVFVPLTLFGSSPPIPTPVLVKALRVDAEVVDLLKSKFTGGY
ncbi:hypothetical protein PVAP13_9KG041914 [Panicum virgatum]|uniref:Cupin type-1 domain-containing protein n=1 Tax=Panicum virgatum TaxID=38727 RepID=A0A8T0NCC8_PANVG|nr:hypothetical protein PVAP13_9KG041914 [Panicum virgatum]